MSASRIVADRKVDDAREKIRQWGASIAHGAWDWHLLGHALQYAHEAIESDPHYQRPWTILADTYHRIGKEDLAEKCLNKSYSLATPGPNFPGRFYKEVERNIRSGFPFNVPGGLRRQIPPQWFEEKYRRYWIIIEVFIEKNYSSQDSVPTVFISYARENDDAAERLGADLKIKGIAVWKDTHQLLPGEEWEKKIKENLQSQDFVILCLSKIAVKKTGFFQVEIKEALNWQRYRADSQVYLIPVRLDECDVPFELRKFQWVDLYSEWQNGVEKIAKTIVHYRKA